MPSEFPSIRDRLATTVRDRLSDEEPALGGARLVVRRVADDPRPGFTLRLYPDDARVAPDASRVADRLSGSPAIASIRVVSPAELRVVPAPALIAAALGDAHAAGERFGESASSPSSARYRVRLSLPPVLPPARALRARAVADALERLLVTSGALVERIDTPLDEDAPPRIRVERERGAHVDVAVGPVTVDGDPAARPELPAEDVAWACLSVSPPGRVVLDPVRLAAGAESPLGRAQAFHARVSSQLRYAARGRGEASMWRVEEGLLDVPAVAEAAHLALDLPDVVRDAARQYDPVVVARYLGVLQAVHHRYYATSRIVADDRARAETGLVIASVVRRAARLSLTVLGASAPDRF
jgi:hypothetical protein